MKYANECAAVKTAWRMLVDDVGGVEAMSAACECTRSMVSEYQNRNGERHVPAHVIIAAERAAGRPLVTAALARAQGYELVLVDAPRGRGVLANVIAELSKDVGELFATAFQALTHDGLTDDERMRLLGELGNVIRVSSEAVAVLKDGVA